MLYLKVLLFLYFCTMGVDASALEVQSATAGEIKSLSSLKTDMLESGKEKSIDLTEPSLFTSPEHVPVLLIPICTPAANRVQISAEPVESTVAIKNAISRLNDGIGNFVDGYESFETALSAKNVNEAQSKLNQLKAQFPNLPYLFLPQASLAYLRGQKSEAKRLIEKYLELKPNDPRALKLLNSLKVDR